MERGHLLVSDSPGWCLRLCKKTREWCIVLSCYLVFAHSIYIAYAVVTRALAQHNATSANNHKLKHPLRTRETRKKKIKKEEKERCCSYEQIYRTMGLISADRSNKATLLLTIPRS